MAGSLAAPLFAAIAAVGTVLVGLTMQRKLAPPVIRSITPQVPRRSDEHRLHSADRRRRSLFAPIGRRLLSAFGVTNDAWAEAVGGVVIVAPIILFDVRIALPLLGAACAMPWVRRRSHRSDLHQQLLRELPETVDLLSVAVAGGLTVPMALQAVGDRVDGVVATALRDCLTSARHGQRLADVLEQVPAQTGDAVRPLIRALLSAERYGTPIADALGRVAADLRVERRRYAETHARRLPIKLLFPLVVCILPAFVLLTVIPILAASLSALR